MGFSFGAAIEYLKRGRKVSRAGWNGWHLRRIYLRMIGG